MQPQLSDAQVQKAQQILQLWKLMDFTEVTPLPTKRELDNLGRSLQRFHAPRSRTRRLDYQFELPLTGKYARPELPLAEALADQLQLKPGEVVKNVVVYLGSVEREACIRAFSLACCGSMAPLDDSKRPEKGPDQRVPFLEFQLDDQGVCAEGTTRLSPLLCLLDQMRQKNEAPGAQRSLDELLEDASKTIEDDDLLRDPQDLPTAEKLLNALRGALGRPGLNATCELLRQASAAEDGAPATDALGDVRLPLVETAHISLTLFRSEQDAREAEDEPAGGLGPFYYADLEMVENRIAAAAHSAAPARAFEAGGPLADVTRYVITNDLPSPSPRRDVLTDDAAALTRFYADALGPHSIPYGRWPSQFDPALMQQVAINLCVRNAAAQKEPLPDGAEIPDYFSVNGPPGTGKTTMLKDVIAGCVVEKARVLADYEEPDDAFARIDLAGVSGSGIKEDWSFVRCANVLTGHAAEANNYGIVVMSSNNNAVANISKELPELGNLLGGLDTSDPAQAEIRDLFTAGEKDPLLFFSGYAQKIFNAQHDGGQPQGQAQAQAQAAKAAGAARPTAALKGWGHGGFSRKKQGDLPPKPEDVWGLISVPLGKKKNIDLFAKNALMGIGWNRGVEGDVAARWSEARKRFLEQYQKVDTLLMQLGSVARAAAASEREQIWEKLEVAPEAACRKIGGTEDLVGLLRRGFGDEQVEDDEREDARKRAQLAVMWAYPALNRERERLFALAMELMTRFVQASKCVRTNLRLLGYMWGQPAKRNPKDTEAKRIGFSPEARRAAMPALLQSLLLAVPVVSTTFASAGRMLAHVTEPQVFGLLIIDESGQAVPSQAVGALFRSRRALVVGDPKQIEPVVTEESQLIARAFPDELQRNAEPGSSVQSTVDAQNPVGSTLGAKTSEEFGDPLWVGSPLLVHRRCISPMFDVSNELSYEGAMLLQTGQPSAKKVATFSLPTSFWLDVEGHEKGSKNHFVAAQAEALIPYLTRAFELAAQADHEAERVVPSVFLISPFTSVVRGLKETLGRKLQAALADGDDAEAGRMDVKGWCSESIGTVHTFQGKEANEVFFVLGCDREAKGAVSWVPANIVNVAATRAKYRFCAVGDSAGWQGNKSARTMLDLLETWLGVQWEMANDEELLGLSASELKEQGFPAREKLPDAGTMRRVDGDDYIRYLVVVADEKAEPAVAAVPAPTTPSAPEPEPLNPFVEIPQKSSLDDPWLSASLTLKRMREQEGIDTGRFKTASALVAQLIELGLIDPGSKLPTSSGLARGIRIGRRTDPDKGTTIEFAVYGIDARAWLRTLM